MHDDTRHLVVDVPFDRAVALLLNALAEAGFVVSGATDVRQLLAERLGQDLRRYILLTALHPARLQKALRTDLEIGVRLVCPLAVFELGDGQSVFVAADPVEMLLASGPWRETHPDLIEPAATLAADLGRVLQSVARRARARAEVA